VLENGVLEASVHKIISLIQAWHISMCFWYRNFLKIENVGKVFTIDPGAAMLDNLAEIGSGRSECSITPMSAEYLLAV